MTFEGAGAFLNFAQDWYDSVRFRIIFGVNVLILTFKYVVPVFKNIALLIDRRRPKSTEGINLGAW